MIIPVNSGSRPYDIVLERGALKNIGEILGIKDRRALIVTDSGVPKQYAETVASSLENAYIHVFEQGEGSKNFETYQGICAKLLTLGFDRKDCVIAVGGGVAGDMAGFAAATYMRGIDFYNIPTTVLSQVDSSIGGKTAIDFMGVKNIIGAFYQPKKVVIDPNVLSTLPARQISNGLAEAVKMGVTCDEKLFVLFKDKNNLGNIEEIIYRSLMVKKNVVEQDEKESGLRKVLNFGHTIGHAIESSVGLGTLYHGECVALGMLYMCCGEIKDEVKTALVNAGLPVKAEFDTEKAANALSHDKKSSGKTITAVKCSEIGSFFFEETTAEDLIKLIK